MDASRCPTPNPLTHSAFQAKAGQLGTAAPLKRPNYLTSKVGVSHETFESTCHLSRRGKLHVTVPSCNQQSGHLCLYSNVTEGNARARKEIEEKGQRLSWFLNTASVHHQTFQTKASPMFLYLPSQPHGHAFPRSCILSPPSLWQTGSSNHIPAPPPLRVWPPLFSI